MHAYLIVGGDKQTRAKKLEAVLSQKGVGRTPGQRFNLGLNTDSSLKIEDVREAEVWVGLARKNLEALIIEEADRLTLPAQHAFLKTLEEPGKNILIILTAADGLSLLPTIRSRCKIIRLPAAAAESVAGDQFAKLNTGTAAERLIGLYPILREITGSTASLHRGAVKRDEAIMFIESVIPALSRNLSRIKSETSYRFPVRPGMKLEAAVTAHRRFKNNLNPTLVLHQFVMDISASD